MKIKTLVFMTCFGFLGTSLADSAPAVPKKVTQPGHCQIEIINRYRDPITITGTFMNGTEMPAMTLLGSRSSYGTRGYISLVYPDRCYSEMHLEMHYTYSGYTFFSDYVRQDSVIEIDPYLVNEAKALAHPK